jgi:hypothetical protein
VRDEAHRVRSGGATSPRLSLSLSALRAGLLILRHGSMSRPHRNERPDPRDANHATQETAMTTQAINCTFTQSQKDQMLNGNWGTGKFLF